MTGIPVFDRLALCWLCAAAVPFVLLFFVPAPYGRHARRKWGPLIGDRLAWLLMESPAALVFVVFFLLGLNSVSIVALVFLVLWEGHYFFRAFAYPFIRDGGMKTPAAVVASGFTFNTINAWLNGRYLFILSAYGAHWLADPRFLVGAGLYLLGCLTNRWADNVLRRLRGPGETGYKVPYGGLFNWVSCPNYLGEIVQWFGWALATWSLPGLAFAVWTVANLAPRAMANHRWYRERFPGYPRSRKALLPGIW